MGIWTGIKHALNSTLGTSDFQSIDKMILGSKGLVESDNLYLNTGINESFTATLQSNEVKILKTSSTIKINWNGSIRLDFVASTNQSSSNRTYVKIYKNDSDIYSQAIGFAFNGSTSIVVRKGDVIKIGFLLQLGNVAEAQSFNVSVTDVKIYADLIDTSGVSII